MGKIGLLLPGQGSQYVGMAKSLYENIPEVKAIYDRANELSGLPISTLCFEGPAEQLNLTENTQPCVMTTDVACFTALVNEGIVPEAVVGFSLGEFAALVCNEIITFEEAMKIVQVRAKAMQEAVPAGKGAMIAVKCDDSEKIAAICKDITDTIAYVEISNNNSPTQMICAGAIEATDELQVRLAAEGIKCTPLAISIPSHCKLMLPAAKPLAAAFEGVELHEPKYNLYLNADGQKTMTVPEIKEKVQKQLYVTVQVQTVIRSMIADGIDTFIECGPNTMYTKFAKQIMPEATILRVDSYESLQETLKVLRG